MKFHTDPHRDGHERFRVSKKNLEDKLPNPSLLNELQEWDTTLGDGLNEIPWDDQWHPDSSF